MPTSTPNSEPFDTKAFLEFCRSKPRGERYDPSRANACALAQFGHVGLTSVNYQRRGVPAPVYNAAVTKACYDLREPTFGRLASRLAKLVGE